MPIVRFIQYRIALWLWWRETIPLEIDPASSLELKRRWIERMPKSPTGTCKAS